MALTPLDKTQLAHLLRRAGFGARPDEWRAYSELGLEGTLAELRLPKAPE